MSDLVLKEISQKFCTIFLYFLRRMCLKGKNFIAHKLCLKPIFGWYRENCTLI